MKRQLCAVVVEQLLMLFRPGPQIELRDINP